jgi:hypothetical protein
MKKIAMVTGLLCVSGSVLAADYGLGVSIRSNDSTIYMPIDVSKAFRIEPMLGFLYRKDDYTILDGAVSATDTTTQLNIGTGVFGVTQLAESASVYYGGRVGYTAVERKASSVGTLPGGGSPQSTRDKSDGFFLAPTVGIEYRFSDHFSIGGEAALTYTKVDGDQYTEETTSTSTNIIFRYMF